MNYFNTQTNKLLLNKWIETTGAAPFENEVAVIPAIEGQYLINRDGQKISKDYEFILPPKDGIYIVKKQGYFGAINSSGTELISPNLAALYPIKENLMCAQDATSKKFGYLNSSNQYIIPAKYIDAKSFQLGAAAVKTESGWGEIDTNDNPIISCEWDDIMLRSLENPTYSWVKKGDKWFNLDIAKKQIVSKGYHYAYNFNANNDAFIQDENGLIGVINSSDQIIIPLRLSSLERANKCYEQMKNDGKSSIEEVEAYRFNLMFDDTRNLFRITEKINENLWDF